MFVSDAILQEQVRRFQQQSRLLSVVPSRYLEQLSRPKQRFLVEETKKKKSLLFSCDYKESQVQPAPPPSPSHCTYFTGLAFEFSALGASNGNTQVKESEHPRRTKDPE